MGFLGKADNSTDNHKNVHKKGENKVPIKWHIYDLYIRYKKGKQRKVYVRGTVVL